MLLKRLRAEQASHIFDAPLSAQAFPSVVGRGENHRCDQISRTPGSSRAFPYLIEASSQPWIETFNKSMADHASWIFVSGHGESFASGQDFFV